MDYYTIFKAIKEEYEAEYTEEEKANTDLW